MTEDEFAQAEDRCDLKGATLIEGSLIKGNPSIIEAPASIRPSDWDGKLDCVARLFGGDGVSKATSNSFVIRFSS
ncbi:hypothetical protein [Sphingomonas aracearum]|nr:hypothetical protein [Sphingomonas aracearum]